MEQIVRVRPVVQVEGLVIFRERNGVPETIGSLCASREEADAKLKVANDVAGAGGVWRIEPAVLVLPGVAR